MNLENILNGLKWFARYLFKKTKTDLHFATQTMPFKPFQNSQSSQGGPYRFQTANPTLLLQPSFFPTQLHPGSCKSTLLNLFGWLACRSTKGPLLFLLVKLTKRDFVIFASHTVVKKTFASKSIKMQLHQIVCGFFFCCDNFVTSFYRANAVFSTTFKKFFFRRVIVCQTTCQV